MAEKSDSAHRPIEPNAAKWRCELRDAAYVEGWATKGGKPTDVDVRLNGRLIWSGPARRMTTRSQERGREPIGFCVELPPMAEPAEVVASVGGFPVARFAIAPHDRILGVVDEIESGPLHVRIRGWAVDRARPSASTCVEIRLGGRIIEVLANLDRPDVRESGLATGMHGFDVIADRLPGETIEVLASPGRVPLGLPPERATFLAEPTQGFSREAEGALDDHGLDVVVGWARSVAEPRMPIDLDVLLDNTRYASQRADDYRPDLELAFGEGRSGFCFDAPWPLPPDFTHKVEVSPRNARAFARPLVRLHPAAPATSGADADFRAVAALLDAAAETAAPDRLTVAVLFDDEQALADCRERLARVLPYTSLQVLPAPSPADRVASTARILNQALQDAWHETFLVLDARATPDARSFAMLGLLRDRAVLAVGAAECEETDERDFRAPAGLAFGAHVVPSGAARARLRRTRLLPHLRQAVGAVWSVPATGAAFCAFRRDDAKRIGGFDEAYDTELCLADLQCRLRAAFGGRVVCGGGVATRPARAKDRRRPYALEDMKTFEAALGYALARARRRDLFARPGFWTAAAPRIVFAVTDASDVAAAGDYHTARELGKRLAERCACVVSYVDIQSDWSDVRGADVLIAMRHDYDVAAVRNASPDLFVVGWARNWIELWDPTKFDLLFVSSELARRHLTAIGDAPTCLLPIATNAVRFGTGHAAPELATDYCFVGNRWGMSREAIDMIDPAASPFRFALYGKGWEDEPRLAPFWKGFLPYDRLPALYASTRIVVDDANIATKGWGSVNSRVFDALAAGALVLTNGAAGARETFGDRLPVYANRQELEDLLWRYLSDEPARRALVDSLRADVAKNHDYRNRAQDALAGLADALAGHRIVIKVAAPTKASIQWGDLAFATNLARAFVALGVRAGVCTRDMWESAEARRADVVISLLGLESVPLRRDQINIAWLISHPDKAAAGELSLYDHVFVASDSFARKIGPLLSTPSSALLQCCDARTFNFLDVEARHADQALFVGNTRGMFRAIVKDALAAGAPLRIVGSGWKAYAPDDVILAEHAPYASLPRLYRDFGVVLNDHWDDMRREGFLSNRLFDAAACGAVIVSDCVEGIEATFGDVVRRCEPGVDFGETLARAFAARDASRQPRADLAERVRRDHSFDARAREMLAHIVRLDARRRKGL